MPAKVGMTYVGYAADGHLVMEAESSSRHHALTLGEDTFVVHLSSRGSWTGEWGEGSIRTVLQIVNGVVVIDRQS